MKCTLIARIFHLFAVPSENLPRFIQCKYNFSSVSIVSGRVFHFSYHHNKNERKMKPNLYFTWNIMKPIRHQRQFTIFWMGKKNEQWTTVRESMDAWMKEILKENKWRLKLSGAIVRAIQMTIKWLSCTHIHNSEYVDLQIVAQAYRIS